MRLYVPHNRLLWVPFNGEARLISKTWREALGGWSPSPTTLLLWLAICTCTTAAALWFGEQHADDVIRQRERAIAADVVASIEHMIDTVELHGRRRIEPLVGQPCDEISEALNERQSYIPYLRVAA